VLPASPILTPAADTARNRASRRLRLQLQQRLLLQLELQHRHRRRDLHRFRGFALVRRLAPSLGLSRRLSHRRGSKALRAKITDL
jgi:hypothetical protein